MEEKPFFRDYPFEPHFKTVLGLKIHYIDEGPIDGPVIVLLHGVPSWSYIYRHMIPPLTKAGHRVIAPDLIGFGKSDKLAIKKAHCYEYHIDWIRELIMQLGLSQLVLFGQDWGAIIGMHLATTLGDQLRGLILSNGVITTGEEKLTLMIRLWIFFARYSPLLPVGWLINAGCRRKLAKFERDAYNWPFPSAKDLAGVRALPSFIPLKTNQVEAKLAWEAWEKLVHYEKPVLTLFSDGDPFTRNGEKLILERVPGAQNQAHKKLHGGHFIQEDAPELLVEEISSFIKALPK